MIGGKDSAETGFTLKYYDENAGRFLADTAEADFSETQNIFLERLPQNALILDFGCGSGRDTLAFLKRGYRVEAVDGSSEMCRAASGFTGIPVKKMLFQELDEKEKYDGIWACSSILHLPKPELEDVLDRMNTALKKEGSIYASFKYGTFEGERKGRYFTDFTEDKFLDLIDSNEDLKVEKMWISGDVRAGREKEKWLNIIMRKENISVMKISKHENIFTMDNGRISYVFSVEKDRYLMNRYFGKHIRQYAGSARPIFFDRGFCSNPDPEDKQFSLDTLPQEYPDMNQGDFRTPAYIIRGEDGCRVTRFFYKGYEIIRGKPALKGLPSVYAEQEDEARTLCVTLEDDCLHARIRLYYTIFRDYDVICRHVEMENTGEQELYIERLMSMSIDFAGTDYDLMTLTGSHICEKNINRRAISGDSVVIESSRGSSSPQETPCVILLDKSAGEDSGRVWGFNYVYSGDFQAVVQTGQYRTVRVQMGMNPNTFGWRLGAGQSFVSPETVMVYSDSGLGGMSRTFHELYRRRLCRGAYRDKERPVLLNSWEAFYFHTGEEACLSLAEQAAKLGVELFVVDDGWFVKRDTDRAALGDWREDPGKFPGGLASLAEKIREMGMNFGIWFEPEMVSPDSDLYRAHPDWIIRSRRYSPVMSRNQYVLDLSRPEVCDYVFRSVAAVLEKTEAAYVKWDMNRHITDLGSGYLDGKSQRELSHRYMLGLYSVLERLNRAFPEVLFEGCSSGGGRYDAGMLYYMPQTWASDNTDAVCRLKIQYGTSILFPPVTMGSHVSDVPNHQVGRVTPLSTRFAAAMSGNLGYELDLRKLTEEEREEIGKQIRYYKGIRDVIQKGRFYRLINPQSGNEAAWDFVSEDGGTVVFFHFRILSDPLSVSLPVKLKGLDPESVYRLEEDGRCFGGDELMYSGITCYPEKEDFSGHVYVFRKEEPAD